MNITLRDIAKQSGVSHATVSMALRNDPRISLATRNRITALAATMGYRRDPDVSALMQHLRTRRERYVRGVLVYLDMRIKADATYPHLDLHSTAATTRASELGYEMQILAPCLEGLSDKRLNAVLSTRGIRGVLVGPSPAPQHRLNLNWDPLAGVMLGHSFTYPPIDRITQNFFHVPSLALDRLEAIGAKRIGLVISEWHNLRTDRQVLAGYVARQQQVPRCHRIPPLVCPGPTIDRAALLRWLQRYRPEAVLIASRQTYAVQWLWREGIKVPEDLLVALLDLPNPDGRISGVFQDPIARARRGAEYLIMKVEAHERGLPKYPITIQIESRWVEGETTRRPAPQHAATASQ